MQLMRPYLHEFLTACYPHFNIIIWYSSARAVALRRVLCHGCAPCSGMSRSATTMRWIEAKLDGMGVSSSPHFKISMYFDATAMITGMSALKSVSMNDRCANMGRAQPVTTPKYGLFNTKPLGVLWGLFPELCTPENTIMFDDLGTRARCVLMHWLGC